MLKNLFKYSPSDEDSKTPFLPKKELAISNLRLQLWTLMSLKYILIEFLIVIANPTESEVHNFSQKTLSEFATKRRTYLGWG